MVWCFKYKDLKRNVENPFIIFLTYLSVIVESTEEGGVEHEDSTQ